MTIKKHLFDSPAPSSKFTMEGNVDETEDEENTPLLELHTEPPDPV